MSFFWTYLRLGFDHITDFGGYDHMLFLLVLVAIYPLQAWRSILWLVTAFTLGHSLSLALAITGIWVFSSDLIELLIPFTIFVTAVSNLLRSQEGLAKPGKFDYGLVLFFGLIHGLGFSNYLRLLLSEGSLFTPLFAFNIGLEAGQLLIVFLILLLANFAHRTKRISPLLWNRIVSGSTAVIALLLMWENRAGIG